MLVFDCKEDYIGSANLTGAGIGMYFCKFVDANGDKMISDITFETYIEYNRRYPDGSGDELMYSMGLVEEYFDEDDIEYYKRSLKYFDEYGDDE